MAASDKELERLLQEKAKHRGEWLTAEAAADYRKRAEALQNAAAGQDIGERRRLRVELQEKYGLLEIEAVNILNGYHTSFYVDKYYRLKNCIPLQTDRDKPALSGED